MCRSRTAGADERPWPTGAAAGALWQALDVTSGPTRRAVLGSGLAGLLSACTPARPHRTVPAPPDPDLALSAAAAARERTLLAAYDSVLASTPALAAQLQPVRAEHLAHLFALGAPAFQVAGHPPSASPRPPAAPSAARARLAVHERRAAAAHAADALSASRRLAPVLASLAASEASHHEALG